MPELLTLSLSPPERVCYAIRAAQSVAIVPHISPDGDALGSAFALSQALQALGKSVCVYVASQIPNPYMSMRGASEAFTAEDAKLLARTHGEGEPYDLMIAVDCADVGRLGDCSVLLRHAGLTMAIDHHGTNGGIADLNYIDKNASATCVLIYEICLALGVPIDRDIALCVYTGISTDTGHFSQRNTNPRALEVAAACLATGIDGAWLAEILHKTRSINKTRLISRALSSIKTCQSDRVIAMCLSKDDFASTGCSDVHTEGIIDFGIAVRGSLAAVLCAERDNGVRVSMRARPPVNVADVACRFGGGGHALAAGCTINRPLGEAMEMVVSELVKSVKSVGNV